jgi:hypothetical protein
LGNGQPGEVDGDAPHLIPAQALVHGATRRFIVEIDIRELLPVRIGDDEALFELLDRPGRREAARAFHFALWGVSLPVLSASP